jgi:hypothetical protein
MTAPFSCDQCEERVPDYLLRALEPEALSAVTEHLSTCSGLLLLKPDDPHAVLIVQDLQPLPRDRAYQLWLRWGDRQRDNGGVFRVDEQGFGLVYITAPQPFTTYQRVGITEEPAGGSPGPTSPRVIGGTP